MEKSSYGRLQAHGALMVGYMSTASTLAIAQHARQRGRDAGLARLRPHPLPRPGLFRRHRHGRIPHQRRSTSSAAARPASITIKNQDGDAGRGRHAHPQMGQERRQVTLTRGRALVKFGWCAPLKDIDLVMQAGFDYIELPLAAQGLEDRATFEPPKRPSRHLPCPPPPSTISARDMKVVGPDIDVGRVKAYLARAADLCTAGAQRSCVFGAAWARNIPQGWPRDRAEPQFLETLGWCADALQGTGVTLAIEPLYRKIQLHQQRRRRRPLCPAGQSARDPRARRPLSHGRGRRAVRHADRASPVARPHPSRRHRAQKSPAPARTPTPSSSTRSSRPATTGLMSCECSVDDPATGLRHSVNFLRQRWSEQSADQPPLSRDTARQ